MSSIQELKGDFLFLPMEKVAFGPGTLEKLPSELDRLHAKRAFIIISKTLASRNMLGKVEELLGHRYVGCYNRTEQHVPRRTVLEAALEARRLGTDALVSIGGGTCIDTAKGVALALAESIVREEELDRYRIKFTYPDKIEVPSLTRPPLPHIAVPTTLSAGEHTGLIGITEIGRKVKDIYADARLVPRTVILDPELSLETPQWLWLGSGLRAVDHCIESLYSRNHLPFTDALAYNALEMLFRNLPESMRDPRSIHVRGKLQIAVWMSIFGLININLGLSHGIGHQLGARCNVPHGYTSSVMLSHVMKFNLPVVAERLALVAQAAGKDIRGLTTEQAAILAIETVSSLVATLKLPQRLRDVGVRPEEFEAIANDALEDMIVATNPRPVTGKQQIIELLHEAW